MVALVAIANLVGLLAGMIAAQATVNLGYESFLYGSRLFWHNYDMFYSLMKALVFGFIIPLISVHMGMLTRGGAEGRRPRDHLLRRLHDHRRAGGGRDVPAAVPQLRPCPTVIEYRNVHKTFDVPVLAGLSFTVETGEILAILGPSGHGQERPPEDDHRAHRARPRRRPHRRRVRLPGQPRRAAGHPPQGRLRLPERRPVRLHERLRERRLRPARGRGEDARPRGGACAGSRARWRT